MNNESDPFILLNIHVQLTAQYQLVLNFQYALSMSSRSR